MKSFVKSLPQYLLIILPAILFFSYHPTLTIASTETMNLEFSLPELWLILFFLCSLPQTKYLKAFFGLKRLIIASVIPLYFSISAIWSDNPLRTILTSGILWLVTYTVLYLIYYLKTNPRNLRYKMISSLLISATLVSIFCWIQCALDIIGVSREYTLLCRGCTFSTFGFPHPSGFAIEPQFMGNLLIAPSLLCFYLKDRNWKLNLLTLFLTSTLFLTFSRGAIYAFLIALIFMSIITRKNILTKLLITAVSFVIALFSFGVFAAISPTPEGFIAGPTRAVHQLTLGVVDLRPVQAGQNGNDYDYSQDSHDSHDSHDDNQSNSGQDIQPVINSPGSSFDGYVAESTNTRLNLNELAFRTWLSSTQYILVGAGLGSAGPSMNKSFPEEVGPKEIVQNEYVSLLLETGCLGIALIVAIAIFTAMYLLKKKSLHYNQLFISIIFAFSITLLFFSGLPNALHIYLLPILFFNFSSRTKDQFFIAKKV